MTLTPIREGVTGPMVVPAMPSARRIRGRFAVLRLVASGVVVAIMADSTATTLAIPVLSRDPLAAALPLAEVTWVSTVNFAAVAALLATAGRFADLLGRRSVLALGLALYGLGATTVIAAPSWTLLLAGRVAQGVGAALMFPASLALLLGELPANRRAGAIALWSASSGIGALALQGGGGWLLTEYGWRGLFLPGAGLAAALLMLTPALPRNRGTRRGVPDLLGAALLIGAIAAAVLAISQGSLWGWTSARTLACAGAAGLLFGGAIATSWRHPLGAIDMNLWRRPGFLWAGGASCLYGAASFVVLAMGPLYLRASSFDTATIGLWLTPISIAMIVSSPLATPVGRRIGLNGVVYSGALMLGTGCALMLAQPHPNAWCLLGAVLLGTGFGFLSTGTFTVGSMAADPSQYASAVGAINTARMLGGAIGVAGASVLIDHPVLAGPMPGFSTVMVACLAVAVLLGVSALGRVASASGNRPRRPSLREAEAELVLLRGLLAELRDSFVQVRSEAEHELARFGVRDPAAFRALDQR
ncbi:MFS transporter [Nonomuraea sp. NEAU-A123]|uniref:MFS transporter n=1 Tax=Nonomuraea sp. NEAU-A123 TaxID=2839649 RepID=UPI001BE3E09E|nr:MFS transporter [Nonomuraea sp. NEAU-A123]MBT2226897.1 MFS transporter [Nonomuraea sp. NEAU-A123]